MCADVSGRTSASVGNQRCGECAEIPGEIGAVSENYGGWQWRDRHGDSVCYVI